MNTAYELMDQLQGEGARLFARSALATDHSRVVRKVRRDRALRTSVLSLAGVAVAGAAAFGVANLGTAPLDPVATPSTPSDPFSPSPNPSTLRNSFTLSVWKQETIGDVARELASRFGVDQEVAMNALINALPPEANGSPEGWVAAGDHTFLEEQDPPHGLQNAADQLVGVHVQQLEAMGVPRDAWAQTVILASIIQQEAPAAYADQTGVARVLLNRVAADMPIMVESAPVRGLGLPTEAIGAFTPEVLDAAANPADGDWLYFLRTDDGNVRLFTTYEEFNAAVAVQ